MEDKAIVVDQSERIRMGDMARGFLASPEWRELVSPIIDSMIKGLTDIRNLKSAELSSESKAKSEVMARKLASDYISEIQILIDGFVADADTILKAIEIRKHNKQTDFNKKIK